MCKKAISTLLALSMIFSMIGPITSYAEIVEESTTVVEDSTLKDVIEEESTKVEESNNLEDPPLEPSTDEIIETEEKKEDPSLNSTSEEETSNNVVDEIIETNNSLDMTNNLEDYSISLLGLNDGLLVADDFYDYSSYFESYSFSLKPEFRSALYSNTEFVTPSGTWQPDMPLPNPGATYNGSPVVMFSENFQSYSGNILDLNEWDISNWETLNGLFSGISVNELRISNWNTSSITNIDGFLSSSSIVEPIDLSGWNTGNITSMSFAFGESQFSGLNLDNWDTTQVYSMSYMFQNTEVPTLDISDFNTASVYDFNRMFEGAVIESLVFNFDISGAEPSNLGSIFDSEANAFRHLDLSNWDLDRIYNITNDLSYILTPSGSYGPNTFIYLKNQNLVDIATQEAINYNHTNMFFGLKDSNVVNGVDEFYNYYILEAGSGFEANLSLSASFKNAIIAGEIFTNSYGITWSPGAPLPNPGSTYYSVPVVSYNGMFNGVNVNMLDFSLWDTSNVTDMTEMFKNITLSEFGIKGLTVPTTAKTDKMFAQFGGTVLSFENFDTAAITSMIEWFRDAQKESLTIKGLNTASVTNMSGLFRYGRKLEIIDVSESIFDTSKVADMSFMFAGANNIKQLDTSFLDTSSLVNATSMFHGVGDNYRNKDMTGMWLDVSNLDTSNLKIGLRMFYGVPYEIRGINFNLSNLNDGTSMFGVIKADLDLSNIVFNDTKKSSYLTFVSTDAESLNGLAPDKATADWLNTFDSKITWTVKPVLEDFYVYSLINGNTKYSVSLTTEFRTALENAVNFADSNGTVWEYGTPLPDPGPVYNGLPVVSYYELFNNLTTDSLDLSQWDMSNVENISRMFSYSSIWNLNISNWQFQNLEDVSWVFEEFTTYTSLNLNNWDTSKVTDMSGVFSHSDLSYDIKEWNTSNVTHVGYMFESVVAPDYLKDFDFSNVVSLGCMFQYSDRGAILPYIDVKKVINDGFYGIFNYSDNYDSRVFDIKNWNLQDYPYSVDSMMYGTTSSDVLIVNSETYERLFTWKQSNEDEYTQYAKLLMIPSDDDFYTYSYKYNYSNPEKTEISVTISPQFKNALNSNIDYVKDSNTLWQVNDPLPVMPANIKTIDCSKLFNGVNTESIADFRLWDFSTFNFEKFLSGAKFKQLKNINFSNLTSFGNMFFGYKGDIEFRDIDFVSITDLSYGFSGIVADNVTLRNLDFANATTGSGIFANTTIKKLTVENWNIAGINSLSFMFSNSRIDSWTIQLDTSHITDMSKMFYETRNTHLALDWLDTSNVTNMEGMFGVFYGRRVLESVDLSNFNTSKVTNMREMFVAQNNLKTLNLENFDTSKVTDMYQMFAGVANNYRLSKDVMPYINVESFDTSNVTNMNKMFEYCSAHIIGLNFDMSKVTNADKMFNYIARNLDLSNINLESVKALNPSSFVTTNNVYLIGYAATQELCDWLNNYDKGWITFSPKYKLTDFYNFTKAGDVNTVSLTDAFKEKLLANEPFTDSNGLIWNPETPLPNPIDNMLKKYSIDGIFKDISLLNVLDLSLWDSFGIVSMKESFANSNIKDLKISSWIVQNIEHFDNAFRNFNQSLTQEDVENNPCIDLSTWDTNVSATYTDMFSGASLPRFFYIRNFNIDTGTKMFEDFADDILHIVYVKDSTVAELLTNAHDLDCNYRFFVEQNANDYYTYTKTDVAGEAKISLKDAVKQAISDGSIFVDSNGNRWSNELPLPNPASWVYDEARKIHYVKNFKDVFRNISAGQIDLTWWETPYLKYADAMFYNCKANVVGIKNLNTENMTTAEWMLSGIELDSLDLSGWNLSKLTSAFNFFQNSKIKDLNMAGVNLSANKTLQNMFYNFQGNSVNLDDISISSVENMQSMFEKANIKTLSMANWDVSKVANTIRMFGSMTSDTLAFDNWTGFDSLVDMTGMFEKSTIPTANLKDLEFSKVENMSLVFSESKFEDLTIPDWNVSSVSNFSKAFYTTAASTIDISNWDVSNATSLGAMFQSSLATTINVGDFSFNNPANISWMFASTLVEDLNLENWDVSNVENISCLFYKSKLEYADLSKWDTSNFKDISWVFAYAPIKFVDVSGWDTQKVTTAERFLYSTPVENIDISSFDTTGISNISGMFNATIAPYIYVKTQADKDYLTANAGQSPLQKYLVRETIDPVIEISQTTGGQDIWNTEDVKLHVTVSDDNIVTSIAYTTTAANPVYGSSEENEFDITLSHEGEYFFKVTASDIFGNKAEEIFRIKIDKSSPVIGDYSLVQTPNGITLKFYVEESLSGFKYLKYKLDNDADYTTLDDGITSVDITEEYNGSISVIAYDNLLQESSEAVFENIVYDSTAPQITTSSIPSWYTTDAVIEVSATDASGIKSLAYTTNEVVPQSDVVENGKITLTNEGQYILTIKAIDNTDNESAIRVNINIDKTAPVVEGSNLKPDTTYTSSVTIVPTIKAGSSAIDKTYYKLNTGDWVEYVNSFDVKSPYDGEVFVKAVSKSSLEVEYRITEKLIVTAPAPSGGSSGGGSYIPTYTLKFETDKNGHVEVDGKDVTSIKVNKGTDKPINIVPSIGYEIDKFILDGKEINTDYVYTFKNVTRSHVLKITFKECVSSKFDDIDVTAWYHEYVDYVVEKGVMNGVAEDTFSPEKYVTRAQIVAMLSRLKNVDTTTYPTTSFKDIDDSQWYVSYINWALAEGIINGYGNDLFGPDDELTREQFLCILYRFAKGKDTDEDWSIVISDFNNISAWALSAVEWALENELITPSSSKEIYPQNIITRAEAAKILTLFDKLSVEN